MTTTRKKDGDISDLLGGLSIKDAKAKELDSRSLRLQQELDRSGFRIFECLQDLGFFSWNPPRGTPYKSLRATSDAADITKFIDLNGRPDKLVSLSSLRTPRQFESPPPDTHENRFPFGKNDAACLHVACRHRGADWDGIDFAFGGSTLEMLASRDASDPYVVTVVGSDSGGCKAAKKTILVTKNKEYVQNLADVGFQFERLVTGKPMRGEKSTTICSVEHLHVMNVGTYRVFFRAETDAIDEGDGDPIEIKASNPRYWGTKVMFQMISSGSTRLCHGTKGGGYLRSVAKQSLRQVAQTAMIGRSIQAIEGKILAGMESLQNQMKDAREGETFRSPSLARVGGSSCARRRTTSSRHRT